MYVANPEESEEIPRGLVLKSVLEAIFKGLVEIDNTVCQYTFISYKGSSYRGFGMSDSGLILEFMVPSLSVTLQYSCLRPYSNIW